MPRSVGWTRRGCHGSGPMGGSHPATPRPKRYRYIPRFTRRAAKRKKRPQKATPVQDEWGFFDPQQCGFAALLAKLDEITENEETGKPA